MRIAKPIIAGNWKLNHGPAATRTFLREFLPQLNPGGTGSVVICPPSVSLAAAADASAGGPELWLGAQNVYWETSGAFTGEISAGMAREAGARLVLVGHSERRHVFGETVAETVKKVRAVLDAELIAVLCVGEQLEERESGSAESVVETQLEAVAEVVAPDELERLVIAYEPVWAIGTGRTATPDDASQMHGHIRGRLTSRFGHAGGEIPILYGGSVKPENAEELLAASDVDGLLVGGASLDPSAFGRICALRS